MTDVYFMVCILSISLYIQPFDTSVVYSWSFQQLKFSVLKLFFLLKFIQLSA